MAGSISVAAMVEILADFRWIGPHGIGRFASQGCILDDVIVGGGGRRGTTPHRPRDEPRGAPAPGRAGVLRRIRSGRGDPG